jgi:hypothetical protein
VGGGGDLRQEQAGGWRLETTCEVKGRRGDMGDL